MSTAQKPPPDPTTGPTGERHEDQGVDKAQYGLAALLAALGAYTIYDATPLNLRFADQLAPREVH
jgi:putative tricarboxylic transport membrane protein